jgi:polysaccharide export outer membrane protein
MVSLRGIPPADQNFELKLDERGNINLPYINVVSAVGLTASDLAEKIQNTYIEKEIYKTITVNVVIPTQSYFVRGEVRSPGRFQLVAGVTVVQAIAASGGYTDFAAPAKVKILRGEKTLDVNLPKIEKGRNANIELRAGDVVVVPRSFF